MTSSPRQCVDLVVLFALCVVALSCTSVGAVTILNELPPQGCPNIIRQLEGDNILLSLNGSRSSFHAPPHRGAAYDLLSSLYFQWTDIREVGRNGVGCSASVDTIVFAQSLHLCECGIVPILEESNGVLRTGWNMTIHSCKGSQPNLVASAMVSITNVTTVQEFNETMPGSTAPAFNYTSVYVHPQTPRFNPFLRAPCCEFPSDFLHLPAWSLFATVPPNFCEVALFGYPFTQTASTRKTFRCSSETVPLAPCPPT